MAKKEKVFNVKLYAVIAVIFVAVFLVITCVAAFTARYSAFHPDETAMLYVDSVVQRGDGYNAYKNTVVSKNMKFGDFIRRDYIDPIIYRDVETYYPGDETDGLKGYNDDSYKGEKTLSDDGTLNGQLIEKMYPVYTDLLSAYGWDNYHKILKAYAEKLILVREEVFGDKYMTDEIFFTALEANVASYGDNLTGTEDLFDENTGVQLSYKTEGVYEKVFGADYKLVTKAVKETDIDISEYKTAIDVESFDSYGIKSDDITAAKRITVDISFADGKHIAELDVTVVKIGMSWYVDNTKTDTSVLYLLSDFS